MVTSSPKIQLMEDMARQHAANDPLETTMLKTVVGFAEEVGEVTRVIKRWVYRGRRPYDETELMMELGDVMYNCARLAVKHGWTLEDVARVTTDKYSKREYDEKTGERVVDVP